jgi:ABC-type transport system involved in multi-copper enzyme maturation permease subunit
MRRTLDKNERIKNSFISGLYGYGALISTLIAIGTIAGASIYSLTCWSGFLLVVIVLSPMILFFGASVYLNILGQDFYLNLNDKLSKKHLQQDKRDKKLVHWESP